MEELWKDVEGYEGIYQVSSLGRVRSLDRKVYNYIKRGRVLKPHDNGRKYQQVSLHNGNSCEKHCYIHILVAKAFIENPNGYKQVNHKDFDKTNNCVENLEWVSQAQNREHYRKSAYARAVEEDRQRKIRTKFVERVLKEKEKIIELYKTGLSIKETAKRSGVGRDFATSVLRLYEYIK